ncbi:unnamed protein product [Toxocara canis]|uniref:Retrotransposon protein n=1 Tax=Toxocara canis TaxID=6265 RepID=A0A183V509_TOXCA|nr:unnamed protein product [Toxocara canis]
MGTEKEPPGKWKETAFTGPSMSQYLRNLTEKKSCTWQELVQYCIDGFWRLVQAHRCTGFLPKSGNPEYTMIIPEVFILQRTARGALTFADMGKENAHQTSNA